VTGIPYNILATVLFLAVVGLVGVDLMADARSGAGGLHLGTEGVAAAVALAGALLFLHRIWADRSEAAAWRGQAEELLTGVGRSMNEQFTTWNLTPAESEVGLLLLKGLSFKEIAQVRETGERTSREQARAIYRKASVGGRAELSAWFIEDLLPPE
jgi:DNA-binding CsgD family transcriptional regulator